MPKEADKFGQMWKPKNWFRFWKKGILFAILFGIVAWFINAITGMIATAIGIDITQGAMASLQAGGLTVAITLLVGAMLQFAIGGFLIEYIQNSKVAILKWARK